MLGEGRRLAESGRDVVVGLADTHGRADTEAMLESLERVATRQANYRGATFEELDVDAILTRHPSVVLVDELAHRCVPGGRHEKRWEDVEELLDAGIDVVTSLNVQHLESLNVAVETISGVPQHETVPDAVVAASDQVQFIDITPEQLRARVSHAEVVGSDVADFALSGFFSADRLVALRRLGLRWLDEHDLLDPGMEHVMQDLGRSMGTPERVLVALTGDPEAEHVLRRASHIASTVHAELVGVYVRVPTDKVESEPSWLAGQRRLLTEIGGHYTELAGVDVAMTVLEFARSEGAGQLVLGATRRSRRDELLHGSVINKAIHSAGSIEVHVIPARNPARSAKRTKRIGRSSPRRVVFPAQRRVAAWVAAVLLPVILTTGLLPVRSSLQLAGMLLCNLLAVVGVALLGGSRPAMLATGVAFVMSDFFFAPPFYSLRIGRVVDLIALITFLVVAAAVGYLVDLLARQGMRTAHMGATSENLLRLAADSLIHTEQVDRAIASIRRTFGLDGVCVLNWDVDSWSVEATTGGIAFDTPESAPFTVEIATGRVLALEGSRMTSDDIAALQSFLDQLRFARERALLGAIGETGGKGDEAAPR
jgi:two-component system sensor histidine kinase KdpD